MSRIGNKAITIPSGVTVTVSGKVVEINGKKGKLMTQLPPRITVVVNDGVIVVERKDNEIQTRANHGLVRALIANHIVGVSEGFKKTLKLIGTGYRVASKGAGLHLSLGFSHPVMITATPGVTFSLEGNDTIHIEGADKQQVGQVAANIRAQRPPEPYKGKGIRYIDEVVLRKAGKTATK